MKINIREMNKNEFDLFLERAVPSYAKDKEKSEGLSEHAALELSQKAFSELLPKGLKTTDHYLYSFVNTSECVGNVWLAKRGDGCFIYDLYLDASLRGKGLGKQLMSLIDLKAKELGFKMIRLHVFGHNEVAIKLYENSGYIATNINMAKKL